MIFKKKIFPKFCLDLFFKKKKLSKITIKHIKSVFDNIFIQNILMRITY